MVDCGICNSWILISSSCQTSSVLGVTPRVKSFHSKAYCSCMSRCLQRWLHLLASLHSYCYLRWCMHLFCSNLIVNWINLIHCFTACCILGSRSFKVSLCLNTNDKIILRRGLILIVCLVESNSTSKTLLVDSLLPLSWGLLSQPLPFTTCRHEVE